MAGGRSKKKKWSKGKVLELLLDLALAPLLLLGSTAMAGGRSKKKKWSKGKVKEKLQNAVMFDKATYDKMLKEIPKAKLITPSVVSERLKVNGSVARLAIR